MQSEENKAASCAYIVVQFVRQGRYGAVAVKMLRENGSSTIRGADSINLENEPERFGHVSAQRRRECSFWKGK